jgi:hypothetical protein
LILWRRFRADRRGNIAMIAALSILGLVGSAGLGIDYYNALAAKTRLDLASDAAAIAAINAAQSYIEANSATQTDPALTRLHQLSSVFAIFGASDRDKSLDLKGRSLRNRLWCRPSLLLFHWRGANLRHVFALKESPQGRQGTSRVVGCRKPAGS